MKYPILGVAVAVFVLLAIAGFVHGPSLGDLWDAVQSGISFICGRVMTIVYALALISLVGMAALQFVKHGGRR